jgi:hypothetical protein
VKIVTEICHKYRVHGYKNATNFYKVIFKITQATSLHLINYVCIIMKHLYSIPNISKIYNGAKFQMTLLYPYGI